MTPPVYSGQPPPASSELFTMSQPQLPQLPPEFDASRPPPVPTILFNKKRPADSCEAGPSKIRKGDNCELPDSPCENCVQREIRIKFYKQQMYKLHSEEEDRSLGYKKRLEEYEHGRDLLRTIVGAELFTFLDEFVEGAPQVEDILTQFHQNSFGTGRSTVQRQLLLKLMEYVAGSEVETPTVRVDETTLLQRLSAFARRSSGVARAPPPERDHSASVPDMLCNSSPAQATAIESRPKESSNEKNRAKVSNGLKRITNGHDSSPPSPSSSSSPPTRSTPPPPRPAAAAAAGGPNGLPPPPPPPPPPPASPCPPPLAPFFQAAPPPPPPINRPYYLQSYGPTSNPPFPNLGHNSGRTVAPGSSVMTMRPPSTLTPNMYSEYMMARFQHPPQYFPPFH